MTWSEADIPDQTGRVAVVTGANGGLGYETARALAAKGATVIMAVRDQRKASEAQERILATAPAAALEILPLDLGNLESGGEAAATIRGAHDRLHLLISNAGIMACPKGRTDQGFERQFGTNHLGHFALTKHLLPTMLRTPGARVVTITSTSRHLGRPVDPNRPLDIGTYDPWRAYGRSKLANLHFAVGLHERLVAAGADTASLVAHPGLSNTGLQATSVEASGVEVEAIHRREALGMGGRSPGAPMARFPVGCRRRVAREGCAAGICGFRRASVVAHALGRGRGPRTAPHRWSDAGSGRGTAGPRGR
jgi:NAD(P)-dependent dehydrogenase (short-subunit alcohol dehydrogenase family)